MTEEKCDRIVEGLVVDESGELTLDESFRGHLDECSHCRELYNRVLAAKEEETPEYVPAVMQRIRENCTYIVDGLTVSSEGELVLNESYRAHLDECASCRELYDRVEAAKKEKVPNYVSAVMKRIRKMESEPSPVGWWGSLKDGLTFSFAARRWTWASGLAAAAIAVVLVLKFVPLPSSDGNSVDGFTNIVNVAGPNALANIGNADKDMNLKLDKVISKQTRLLYTDSQGT
ncbi:hypothetical protein ACFL6S_22155 [Candidatus Poribacteria bacterium]